jgi:hypothetical protein
MDKQGHGPDQGRRRFFLKKTGTGKRGNRKTAGTGKREKKAGKRETGKREIFINNFYINFINGSATTYNKNQQ